MANPYEKNAKVMKAFCDENRLRVLEMLTTGEKCACMLLENLNIGQPSLSYHMKILLESGIVESRQEGKWTHYRLSEQGGAYAEALVHAFVNPKEIQQENVCCGK